MSAFDKAVLSWLDNSTLSDKSKLTMLNRVDLGISGYRTAPLDPAPVRASSGRQVALEPFDVDFSLQEHIAKAVRKLENGEQCPKGSLFPNLNRVESRQTTGRRATPRAGATRASASGAEGSSSPARSPTDGRPTFATFSFGESAPNDTEAKPEDGDDVMAEAEDKKRRRMTLNKRASRNAISAEIVRQEDADEFFMPVISKPQDIQKRLYKVLESHHLFSHLDDKDLQYVTNVMGLRSVKKGEKLITQGKENDTFYVVVTGSCIVKTKQNRKVNLGQCIGEVGLMYDNKSEDTVEAAMAMTQVCWLDRKSYQIILAKASQAKRARYEGFLSGLKFLSGLEPHERLQLADSLKSDTYKKGDYLIKFGETGEWFQIILEGTVDVIGRDAEGNKVHVCSFQEGDCVGELEFLFKHKCVADVVAASPEVKTAKMTTFHFEKVIGSAKEVLERKANDDEVYGYYRRKKEEMDNKEKSSS